jgi:transcription initiation factor TFIIIB Brf1 subunit/transcription initiation factor TFIIB
VSGGDGVISPEQIDPRFTTPQTNLGPTHQGRTAADSVADTCPDCNGHTTEILNEDGESHCHSCGSIYKTKKKIPQDVKKDATTHLAENPPPQADMLHAPEEIDTLRDEEVCPICGSVMDAEECEVCGYVEPPQGFDNPDLSKAKDTDLREQNSEDGKEDAFEDIPEGQLGPVDSQPTSNPQALAHVRSDMAWETSLPSRVAATNPDRENPVLPGNKAATDEPKETVLEDPTTPVTSSVRTAREFIAAAGATRRMNMNHTADAASGAPAVATPDKNVDTIGVGGVMDASNEQASKADAQVDVLGVGGTGVESVGSDSTDSLGEASPGSDDSGFNDSKNIEAIPTKTFGDGSSGVERQADPVSSEVFEGNGKSSSWTIEATEDAPFPTDLPRIGEGQKAVQGTEPADPVGKAQDRVDVLQSVTSPSNNSGPTTTWNGTDGNGVTQQQDPITTETLVGNDGVKAAHLFTAFKLADLEVELGLLQKEQKYARVAELESKSSTEVTAALAYAQKVKTAGLARGGQKSASRLPVMSRDASSEDAQVKEASLEIPDEAVFM